MCMQGTSLTVLFETGKSYRPLMLKISVHVGEINKGLNFFLINSHLYLTTSKVMMIMMMI